jgi:hypothetical protein
MVGVALAAIASLTTERDDLLLAVERERLLADRYLQLLLRALTVMQRVVDEMREAK